jgi:hypothetical protein
MPLDSVTGRKLSSLWYWTQSAPYVLCNEVSFPRVERYKNCDHVLPSSVDVKNLWNLSSSPPYGFIWRSLNTEFSVIYSYFTLNLHLQPQFFAFKLREHHFFKHRLSGPVSFHKTTAVMLVGPELCIRFSLR